jgi:hypothetical protein
VALYTILTTRTLSDTEVTNSSGTPDNLIISGLGGTYFITHGMHTVADDADQSALNAVLTVRTLSEPTA